MRSPQEKPPKSPSLRPPNSPYAFALDPTPFSL
jgi:hypothetical protein